MKPKLNIKQTVLLSFGFFASSLIWQVYSAYVPAILEERFLLSTLAIGWIMAIDSIFGVVIQPVFGRLSDKTRTRFGRRLPYLFVCMPICAVLFIFIPYMQNLWSLMGVVIIFTFVMGIWRTPAVSLMPDMTPGPLQSQANGTVNLMGAAGAIIALAGGGILFGLGGFPLPFLVAAIFVLGAMGVLALFVREPKIPHSGSKAKSRKLDKAIFDLPKAEKKSMIFLLLAIFFWFAGYNAVDTFFSLYAINSLGITAGEASLLLSLFAATLVLFAIPAGILGAKFGRRKVIMVGLIVLTGLFFPMIFVTEVWFTGGMLLIGGAFWACVNINSLPMIAKMSGPQRVGAFIGYYYLFSFSAQIITPPLFGWIRDVVGHFQVMFVYAIVGFALAIVCMFFVKHGEEPTGPVEAGAEPVVVQDSEADAGEEQ